VISIQRQLGISLSATLLLIGAALLQGSLWLIDNAMRHYHAEQLRHVAEELLSALEQTPNGIRVNEHRLHPAFQRAYSGRYWRLESDEWQSRSRSLWDSALPIPEQPGLAPALYGGVLAQQLLMYRGDYRRFAQSIRIIVAEDYNPVLASLQRVRLWGLALWGIALLMALALQAWSVRRALRPLEQIRQQIIELHAGRLGTLDTQVPAELVALVKQINHLLHYTEQLLRRSRHAVGNLGHALKTPLAVLFSLSDSPELRQQPALRHALRDSLEHINQRLIRELSRARMAGEALPGAYFDAAFELPVLCDMLRLLHPHLEIQWRTAEGVRLPWDREDVLEMLGNLLDNACKWADSYVIVCVDAQPDGYTLRVEDDGPGIAPADYARVLQRGIRLDEHTAGHGLGLNIVRDIAETCGGTLHLTRSEAYLGLSAQIWLPARAL